MDLVLCKICGERHRLGFCPDVDPSIPPKRADACQHQNQTRPVQQSGLERVRSEGRGVDPIKRGAAPFTGYPPVTGGSGGGAAVSNPDAAPSSKQNRGRPLDKDRDKAAEVLKPWKTEGMSRRTWYRRQHAKA